MPSRVKKTLGEKISERSLQSRSMDPELMGVDSLKNGDSSESESASEAEMEHYVDVGLVYHTK